MLPIWISGVPGHISVEVVDDIAGQPQLPLLLSKSAMAQLHIKIDYATSEAEILGVKTTLRTNPKGH